MIYLVGNNKRLVSEPFSRSPSCPLIIVSREGIFLAMKGLERVNNLGIIYVQNSSLRAHRVFSLVEG